MKEAQDNGFVFAPVSPEDKSFSASTSASALKAAGIYEMDLLNIPDSKLFLRKANLPDFKKSILNCKPTVNPCFLELYARFLERYGHED